MLIELPSTRANVQWVIHGFNWHCNLHFRVKSLFHHLCKTKDYDAVRLFINRSPIEDLKVWKEHQ